MKVLHPKNSPALGITELGRGQPNLYPAADYTCRNQLILSTLSALSKHGAIRDHWKPGVLPLPVV